MFITHEKRIVQFNQQIFPLFVYSDIASRPTSCYWIQLLNVNNQCFYVINRGVMFIEKGLYFSKKKTKRKTSNT